MVMRYSSLVLTTFVIALVLMQPCESSMQVARLLNYSPNNSGFMGGADLTINGLGFSSNQDENRVYVGGKECPMNQYLSNTRKMVCTIPAHELEEPLLIQMFVRGEEIVCSWCKMWYQHWRTPYMYDITPSSCWAGCTLNFYGAQKIGGFVDQFDDIKIGDYGCQKINLDDDEDGGDETALYYQDRYLHGGDTINFIPCQAPPSEAGVYTPSFNLGDNYGLARWTMQSEKTNADGNYIYRMIPHIDSISAKLGGTEGGHRIEIFGSGFSSTLENNQVWIGDIAATIIEVNEDDGSLIVDTGAFSQQTGDFQLGNTGIVRKMWKGEYFGVADPAHEGWTTVEPTFTEVIPTFEIVQTRFDDERYSQMFEGVFTAPATGKYTFLVSSDDYGRLIIDCGGETGEVDILNHYANAFRQIEFKERGVGECDLEAGVDYPFEAYHYEGQGGDHFTLSMIAPALSEEVKNYVRPIQAVSVDIKSDLEVHEIVINNINEEEQNETWRMRYGNSFSSYMRWNASIYDVRTAFYAVGLRHYMAYERIALDSDGNELTDSTLSWTHGQCSDSSSQNEDQNRRLEGEEVPVVTGYVWRFALEPRAEAIEDKDIRLYHQYHPQSAEVSHTTTQYASDSVSGEYYLTYNGVEIGPIAWNISRWTLEYLLRRADPALRELRVVTAYGRHSVGHSFFLILPDDSQYFELARAELLGGNCDHHPQVSIDFEREVNRDEQFWMPIPNEFLHTKHAADDLQVTVKSNDIAAACAHNACSYSYSEDVTPVLTSWTNSGNVFTFIGSGFPEPEWEELIDFDADQDQDNDSLKPRVDIPFAFDLDSDDVDSSSQTKEEDENTTPVRIVIGDTECVITDFDTTSVTCEMPNTVAGEHTPVLTSTEYGQARNDDEEHTHSVDLTITSVSPGTGSTAGGSDLVITGNGFPVNESSMFSVVIDADGLPCNVTSVSTTEIHCTTQYTPDFNSTGRLEVSIPENDLTARGDFETRDADTPYINSVTPSSIGPYIKTSISIELDTNMGVIDDPYDIMVFIGNDDCWYEDYTDYVYTCWVIGSELGAQDLSLHVYHRGCSEPFTFTYEYGLDEITPSQGSYLGGTLLTLTGTGFMTQDETNLAVQIGEGSDMWCESEEIVSNTVMTCRTPPASAKYDKDSQVEVLVHLRAILPTWCETCLFSYSNGKTPGITAISPESGSYESISITTFGMSDEEASTITVMIGEHECTNVTFSSDVVSCDFESSEALLEAGFYPITVLANGLGYLSNSENLVYNFRESFESISPSYGPAQKVEVTVTGNGFTQDSVVQLGHHPCTNMEVTSTSLTCSVTLTTSGDFALIHNGASHSSVVYTANSDLNVSLSGLSVDRTNFDSPVVSFNVNGNITNVTDLNLDVTIGGLTTDFTFDSEASTLTGTFEGGLTFGNLRVEGTFSYDDSESNSIEGHVTTNSDSHFVQTFDETIIDSLSASSGAFGGKNTIELIGQGFDSVNLNNNIVTVCDVPAEVKEATYDSLTIEIPPMVSEYATKAYRYGGKPTLLTGDQFSYDYRHTNPAFDGNVDSFFYTWDTTVTCFFGYDFGENGAAQLSHIRLFPSLHSAGGPQKVYNSIIQGSNDDEEWDDLFWIDEDEYDVFPGWNQFDVDTNEGYRYIRYYGDRSGCWMAELEFYGHQFYPSDESSLECEITIDVNQATQAELFYTYTSDMTPSINSIYPTTGGTKAQEEVEIIFTMPIDAADATSVTVNIDGIDCTDITIDSTSIFCTTGQKTSTDLAAPYDAKYGSNIEVIFTGYGLASVDSGVSFKYVDRWSDPMTWGGAYPPQEGFSAYIPAGQYVLVDESVPRLDLVLIEGTLEWEDQGPHKRLTFDADIIFVHGGHVIIGTEESPYSSHLTITLHGDREDPQIETYGNKVFAVREGSVDMHGTPRDHTWTQLYQTVEAGEDTIILKTSVDWQEDEDIVIASSGYHHREAEVRTIWATLTFEWYGETLTALLLNRPLKHRHYGEIEYYGNWEMDMRAEVGLLSRNIRFRGDKWSRWTGYGAHMMLASEGDETSIGRIEYVEMFRVGQAFHVGRYPINFHMIGIVNKSYVRGCSFHHSYNRAVTIHGVHYLTVEENVTFKTMGHAFFIEDGIETQNRIINNLAIETRRSWSLLNTDQTPASFWITNPNNHFIGNHAAGSDRYGFWFDLPEHPTGSSVTEHVCPRGEPLGTFRGNVGHSNGWYSLRIFEEYTPREDPCEPVGEGNYRQAVFEDYTGWKNIRNAIISERTGALKFTNIKTCENRLGGIEVSVADFTPFGTFVIENSLIVGYSDWNHTGSTGKMRGIIGPRSEGMFITGVDFYNWDLRRGVQNACISTCSHCSKRPFADSGARTIVVQNVYFCGCVTRLVWFEYPYNGIIQDLDGSLTQKQYTKPDNTVVYGGWITPYKHYLDIDACTKDTEMYDGIVCNGSVTLRRVVLSQPLPEVSFRQVDLKIIKIASPLAEVSSQPEEEEYYNNMPEEGYYEEEYNNSEEEEEESSTTEEEEEEEEEESSTTEEEEEEEKEEESELTTPTEEIHEEGTSTPAEEEEESTPSAEVDIYSNLGPQAGNNPSNGWSFPIIVECSYQIHFNYGIDFEQLQIGRSLLWEDGEWAVLKFNHTETREKMEVVKNSVNLDSYLEQYSMMNKFDTHGTFFLDAEENDTYFLLAGETTSTVGTDLTLKGHHCWGEHCSTSFDDVEMESEPRYWGNPDHWRIDRYDENEVGVIPQDGDDVHIRPSWNMVLNINTAILGELTIDGFLVFESTSDITLSAHRILVRRRLVVGSESAPVSRSATIKLYGEFEDDSLSFTPEIPACNKCMVIVGQGLFHGQKMDQTSHRLTSHAIIGDTSISVEGVPSGYWVGQKMLITSSTSDSSEYEIVTISAIDDDVISFTPALAHYHVGEIETIGGQTVDARAIVSLIGHNVIIEGVHSGDNQHNGAIFVGDYLDSDANEHHATLHMDGVELLNLGQHDTDKAALRLIGVKHVPSYIQNCSIRGSATFGIMIEDSDNITVTGNVIIDTVISGIHVESTSNINVSSNTVIDTKSRSFSGSTSEISAAVAICADSDDDSCLNRTFQNNFISGAENWGIAFRFDSCDEPVVLKYAGNVVFGAAYGIANASRGVRCSEISRQSVFFCSTLGIASLQDNSQLVAHTLVLANNAKAVSFNTGAKYHSNSVHFTNSVIAGALYSDCADNFSPDSDDVILRDSCSSSGYECEARVAIELGVSLEGGKPFPIPGYNLPLEAVRQESNARSIAIIENIVFSRFFQKCNGVQDILIKTNPTASDMTTPHIFRSITLHEVDTEYKFSFDNPNAHQVGEEFCGGFACTGLYNVLVEDADGTLLGKPTASTIRSNAPNTIIDDTCTFNKEWNALECSTADYIQLTFESLDSDKYTRIFSPVYILNEDLGYENELNHHRDHDWRGFYTPMRRLSRYGAVLQTGRWYEVYSPASWPSALRYQWNGQIAATEYVILHQSFDTPLKVGVKRAGKIVEALGYDYETRTKVQVTDLPEDQLECGTHAYDRTTQSITVVMKGPDCDIKIHHQDAIEVSMRLDLTVEEFWASTGPTAFVDRLAAVLGINPARIVVVDVREGSTIVDFFITEDDDKESDSDEEDEEGDETPSDTDTSHHEELRSVFDALQTKTDSGELGSELEIEVIEYSVEVSTVAEEKEESTSSASLPIYWTLSAVLTFMALLI